TKAIKGLFGQKAYKIPISSTKSMIGHSIGAAGALEAIVCVMSINNGLVHATINYDAPDPDCDLDYVPNKPRKLSIKNTISNSFGFGGQNACLVISAV
ncbi:MAG TPA: beta-ACP synthase, partial [Anaerolineales bacterium]|nr:beta-ACP synthase [Anaerolineales bacterium]